MKISSLVIIKKIKTRDYKITRDNWSLVRFAHSWLQKIIRDKIGDLDSKLAQKVLRIMQPKMCLMHPQSRFEIWWNHTPTLSDIMWNLLVFLALATNACGQFILPNKRACDRSKCTSITLECIIIVHFWILTHFSNLTFLSIFPIFVHYFNFSSSLFIFTFVHFLKFLSIF